MATSADALLPLGTLAPYFSLPDIDGHEVSLASLSDAPVLLVMFICNHCPFVKHIADSLADFAREFQAKGVAIVAINSNDDTTYPYDSPLQMRVESQQRGYTFPYLFDETQEVARAYRAVCTPDFYVFDSHRRLVYHGRYDASRPGNSEAITGMDLRKALASLLGKQRVPGSQLPSVGCSIKWRAAAATDYSGAGTHPE